MTTEKQLCELESRMERARANGVWHYLVEQKDVTDLIAEVRRLRSQVEFLGNYLQAQASSQLHADRVEFARMTEGEQAE